MFVKHNFLVRSILIGKHDRFADLTKHFAATDKLVLNYHPTLQSVVCTIISIF